MSSPGTVFTPEVEEILRDVAEDPRSTLLKIERPREVRGLLERYPLVSPRAAGLTSAERQLLSVCRDEVAYLLHEVCKYKLANGEKSGLFLNRNLVRDEEVRVWTPEELKEGVERTQGAGGFDQEAMDLLQRCVQNPGADEPSVSSIATVALRLVPSDATRICAGLDYAVGGNENVASGVFADVISVERRGVLAAVAWDNVGWLHEKTTRYSRTIDALAHSSLAAPGRVAPLLVTVFCGFQIGNVEAVLKGCRLLIENGLGESGAIDSFLNTLALRRKAAGWSPSNKSRETWKRLEGRGSPIARRFANVMA